MDSSQSSEDPSSMISSDDDLSSSLGYEPEIFQPPPIFTELLELTTYDDGVQVQITFLKNIQTILMLFDYIFNVAISITFTTMIAFILLLFLGMEGNSQMD